MPLLMSAVSVTTERIFSESIPSRDQTSPKRTSSFSSANFGAKSFNASLPAVCFTMLFFLLSAQIFFEEFFHFIKRYYIRPVVQIRVHHAGDDVKLLVAAC